MSLMGSKIIAPEEKAIAFDASIYEAKVTVAML